MGKRQTRSEARIEAFKLIFQTEVNNDDIDFLFEHMLEELPKCADNIDYIKTAVLGVINKKEELDEEIKKNLTSGWKLERITKVSLAVLRLAIFEIKYIEDVPTNVAINEAIEIEKKFDNPDNSAFVNGVLAGFVKSL
ncbi:MAG: transcription antitermination factor NusB [Clostridia bacterium]|nr:transcription antitermination factor NusB [Clostridia bacterium]